MFQIFQISEFILSKLKPHKIKNPNKIFPFPIFHFPKPTKMPPFNFSLSDSPSSPHLYHISSIQLFQIPFQSLIFLHVSRFHIGDRLESLFRTFQVQLFLLYLLLQGFLVFFKIRNIFLHLGDAVRLLGYYFFHATSEIKGNRGIMGNNGE
jgi:hypothetical protein